MSERATLLGHITMKQWRSQGVARGGRGHPPLRLGHPIGHPWQNGPRQKSRLAPPPPPSTIATSNPRQKSRPAPPPPPGQQSRPATPVKNRDQHPPPPPVNNRDQHPLSKIASTPPPPSTVSWQPHHYFWPHPGHPTEKFLATPLL